MLKNCSIALSILVIAFIPTGALANSKNLIDYAVVIQCGKSVGSGFYLDSTHIVTAKHVVQECSTATLSKNSLGTTKADILFKDSKLDIAILTAKSNFVPSVAEDTDEISKGDPVYIVGTPIDGLVLSQGRVAQTNIPPAGNQFSLSIPADHGNSGGPVFSENGLIGMVTAKSMTGLVIAYDLSAITQVLKLAKERKTSFSPQTDTNSAENNYLPWLQASIITNFMLLISSLILSVKLRKKKSIVINLE